MQNLAAFVQTEHFMLLTLFSDLFGFVLPLRDALLLGFCSISCANLLNLKF